MLEINMPSSRSLTSAASALQLWLLTTLGWWAFAFWPLPTAMPEWVSRAQAACFGNLANGLPGGSGWLLLVFAPGSLLTGLYFLYGNELFSRSRATIQNAITAFLLLLSVFEVTWIARKIFISRQVEQVSFESAIREPLPENYPRLNAIMPFFDLVDQNGSSITPKTFGGKPVILTFVFAHCPSICPMLVSTTNRALEKLGENNVESVFITLDPWRDTPDTLSTLVKEWKISPKSHVLSGPVKSVEALLDKFNMPRTRDLKSGEISHPAIVHIIDPNGKIAYTFNNPPVDWIVSAVDRVTKP